MTSKNWRWKFTSQYQKDQVIAEKDEEIDEKEMSNEFLTQLMNERNIKIETY